ncbi:hypothetical protein LguiA_035739 [Lonicera macranthoides]
MATNLLKKVWLSVSNHHCGGSSVPNQTAPPSPPYVMIRFGRRQVNLIDYLSTYSFKSSNYLAPKSLPCKFRRYVTVSDNRLWIHFLQYHHPWDSFFFAETYLRLGYPLQTCPSQMPELSFMHIYGQRAQLPGVVIIDGGSGCCKFGWSKYTSPSGHSATFLVNSSAQPIVVSVPICQYDNTASAKAARRQLKEAIYSALFGVNVPAVCAINQATLALFAARRTSGIVVNIGFQQTSVVPILHGKVMRKVGVEVVGMGALNLTGFLREQMQQKNISFGSLYTVRSLKENLCYIALDYKAELSKDAEKSFEVAADGWLTLSRERCAMGLHQAVALCMDHCEDAELSGDGERLEKELQKLPPVSMSSGIGVIPPHYGSDSAWFGAKIVSNVSTFPESWCMAKKQFRFKSRQDLTW